jgi:hypothetical protein
LVGATAILGIATFMAAVAAMRAAEHIPTVERAFIFGGIGKGGRKVIKKNGKIVGMRISFSMANYGKTPGFIKYMKVGSGKLSELPDIPDFLRTVPVQDFYFPEMKMDEIRYPDDAYIILPPDSEHVVFQRVFYNDVFGHPHSSGSLYLMYLERGHIKGKIVDGKPKYWEWD